MPSKIKAIVQSGIPVKYSFNIKLKKKGLFWDKELKSIDLNRTINFDNLRNKYFIYFTYPTTKLISVDDLKSAKRYLFYIKNLKIVSLSKLEKSKRYLIEIKAHSEKGESSMPFSRLLKIFTSFGFTTDTYEFEFVYR